MFSLSIYRMSSSYWREWGKKEIYTEHNSEQNDNIAITIQKYQLTQAHKRI